MFCRPLQQCSAAGSPFGLDADTTGLLWHLPNNRTNGIGLGGVNEQDLMLEKCEGLECTMSPIATMDDVAAVGSGVLLTTTTPPQPIGTAGSKTRAWSVHGTTHECRTASGANSYSDIPDLTLDIDLDGEYIVWATLDLTANPVSFGFLCAPSRVRPLGGHSSIDPHACS